MSEIKPLKAEIKIIAIDGRKLTKSIFNQIEIKGCLDIELNFIGDECFGYVNDKTTKYILWTHGGDLRRTNIKPYLELRPATSNTVYRDISWFLDKCKIEYVGYDNERGAYKVELNDSERLEFNEAVKKVNSFLNKVLEHQIFI